MWAKRPQVYAHSCTFMFRFMFLNNSKYGVYIKDSQKLSNILITTDNVCSKIMKLKDGKAPGDDGIILGMWPRSLRLGLEAASRPSNASPRSRLERIFKRLGLASASGFNASVSASVSAHKASVTTNNSIPCKIIHFK